MQGRQQLGAGPGGMPLASGFMTADADLNFRVTQQEHLARVVREMLPKAIAMSHERLCTVSRTVIRGTPIEAVQD